MTIKINPDKDFVKDMRKAIKKNNGYCVCALEKTKDTRCMCKDFIEDTEPGNWCRCGLYYKEE